MDNRKAQQRRELAEHYDSINDQALLAVALDDLTDVAREVYLQELQSRGLEPVPPAQGTVLVQEASIVVWVADTSAECTPIVALLEKENCSPTLVPHTSLTQKCFCVSVPSRHAERAVQLIAPVELNEEPSIRSEETGFAFRSPSCPACQAPHVVLESTAEANSWRCERCQFRWEELPNVVEEQKPQEPVEFLERREDRPYSSLGNRVSVICALLLICGLLVILRPAGMTWQTYLGLALCMLGEVGWGIARWQIGSSFTAKAEARKLVTAGIYSRIQNPIYLFGVITLIGLALYLQRAWWLMLLVVVIPVQLMRIRNERKVLADNFGEAYTRYRKSTWF